MKDRARVSVGSTKRISSFTSTFKCPRPCRLEPFCCRFRKAHPLLMATPGIKKSLWRRFMGPIRLVFAFATLFAASQSQAFIDSTSTRHVQCSTKFSSPKLCVKDVAFRCDYESYSCVALKISAIEQTVRWSLFKGERITSEYAIPTDRKRHGQKLHMGFLYKLKSKCAARCVKPEDPIYEPDPSPVPSPSPTEPSGPSTPVNSCTSTIWCGAFEHCLNGQCVPKDLFNQCGPFNSCSLGETCNNGVCER